MIRKLGFSSLVTCLGNQVAILYIENPVTPRGNSLLLRCVIDLSSRIILISWPKRYLSFCELGEDSAFGVQ